ARGLVLIRASAAGGRLLPRGEPRLEVDVSNLQPPFGAVARGGDAADEGAVMEDGQRVVAVHPLVPGRVDLDAVVEAEEARHPVAIPQERVEGGEQGRPARWRGRSPCPGEGGKVAGEGEPAAGATLDLERRHLATLDHRVKRGAA